jgi:DNA-binding transcriptional regulator YiaG
MNLLMPCTLSRVHSTMSEPAFIDTLRGLAARHSLDRVQTAALLGVPVYTLRHWLAGTRNPTASAVRLLAVLCIVETLAPDLLAALVPE